MKHLVFLLLLDRMLVHHRSFPHRSLRDVVNNFYSQYCGLDRLASGPVAQKMVQKVPFL